MGMMMAGGGLSAGKLELANAQPGDVSQGKKFYAGDKTLKTGTLVERGQYQYAGGIGSGGDYIALNNIPEGIYRKNGADWAPEIRVPTADIRNYLGADLSDMNRIGKAPVYNREDVSLSATLNGNPKYKAAVLIIGTYSEAASPSISISGASYKQIEKLYQEGYSGGQKFTTNIGWIYFIYNMKFPVTINVTYRPGFGNREITLYGIQ